MASQKVCLYDSKELFVQLEKLTITLFEPLNCHVMVLYRYIGTSQKEMFDHRLPGLHLRLQIF